MIGTRGRQLVDDLFAIEQGFWLEGEDYFREHLDDHCLLAFPNMPEMHGPRPRDEVAATVRTPGRWRDLRVSSRQLVRPVPEVAVISYRADVTRADGEPYAALVGSAYVRRENGWKLAFHQHSPID